MHLLVVSHSCATPINQQIYAELERQTGWKITLVVPDAWKDEFGNILGKEKWREFSGDLVSIPVWNSGNIILHIYKENWGALCQSRTLRVGYGPALLGQLEDIEGAVRVLLVPEYSQKISAALFLVGEDRFP
jgi:hypothetical protein